MIIFSIIAILSFFSYSSFSSFLNRSHDHVLQAQLLDVLQLARQESKIRRMPIAICQTDDSKHCQAKGRNGFLIFQNKKQDGVVATRQQIISMISTDNQRGQWFLRSYPLYREFILFFSNRSMQSDNGRFWYCKHHNTLPDFAVILSRSGQTYRVLPDKKGVIKDSQGRVLRCAA
jgi:Tfp pilus assembly protein FimT